MSRRKATVVDLFAGAGGFSLGFQAAGARLVAAVDANEVAGETYRQNFTRLQPGSPPRVLCGDEGNLELVDLGGVAPGPGPDILIGGPPCQGFSRVGRAKLASLADTEDYEDPRNSLYKRFVEAIDFWKPRAVVMENVAGMRLLKGRRVADEAALEISRCGYRVGYAVLNAVWYGVPQFRERLFLIGIREDLEVEPLAPVPTHRATLPSGYLRPSEAVTIPFAFVDHYELAVATGAADLPATSVEEALGDLPRLLDHLDPNSRLPRAGFRVPRPYEAEPGSPYARLMRGWPGLPVPSVIDDHVVRRTPRDYEIFRRMAPDDRYPEALKIAESLLAAEVDRLAADGVFLHPDSGEYKKLREQFVPPYKDDKFADKWRKLSPDQPSWTIPAHLSKDAYSHIHYDSEQARAISVREAARLQSFPDSFAFSGNMGDCFTQIGNAVPPLMAWAVAAQLLGQLGFASRAVPCQKWRLPSTGEVTLAAGQTPSASKIRGRRSRGPASRVGPQLSPGPENG